MRKPKNNNDFTNDFNYVKKNVKPGCIVLMKDQRGIENSRINQENTYIVEKLYDNYALCVNDIGLTECFDYADLTNAYEHGRLEFVRR